MLSSYEAPIFDIKNIKNELIYAKGHKIYFNKNEYTSKYNIHKIKITEDLIFGFGKFMLILIDKKTFKILYFKLNTWIADVSMIDNKIRIATLRGLVYKFEVSKYSFQNHNEPTIIQYIYNYERIKNKVQPCTTLFFDKNNIVSGTWDGTIQIKNKKAKIHDGTVYEIKKHKKLFISCSTDRSVIIFDKKFNIFLKEYDLKNRIFKCGFITDKKAIEKLLKIYHNLNLINKKNKLEDENFSEKTKLNKRLFFYTITECGKLRIYKNDTIVYEYMSNNKELNVVYFHLGKIYLGCKNGKIEKLKLENYKFLGKANNFTIQKKSCIKYYNNFLEKINIDYKINCLHTYKNRIFVSRNNLLFEYLNDDLELIKTFVKPIIKIFDEALLFHDEFNETTNFYRNISNSLHKNNVTSYYKTIIGFKDGSISKNDKILKISNDAITGIKKINNFTFLTCRDGYIYTIENINEEFLNSNKDYHFKTKRKFIANEFLEGIKFDRNIYTYYFSKNNFYLASLQSETKIELSFKPKRYFVSKKYLYFIKKDDLYKVKLFKRKPFLDAEITKTLQINRFLFLCSPYSIFLYVNYKLIDKIKIHDVSAIDGISKDIFVGTFDGKFYILEVIDDKLIVENKMVILKERIMDLKIQSLNDRKYFCLVLLGNGTIINYYIENNKNTNFKICNSVKMNFLYTACCLNLKKSSFYLGRADGKIESLANFSNFHFINDEKSLCIKKLCDTNDYNHLISIGDDQTLKIYDLNLLEVKKILSGFIEANFIDTENFLFTVDNVKKVCKIDLKSQKIKTLGNLNIYKTRGISKVSFKEFFFFGLGYEKKMFD